MFNNSEKIIYFVLFLLFFIVREYYTARYKKGEYIKRKIKILDITLLTLNGIGMIIPLVYVFSGIFDFANYTRPPCLNYLGIFFLVLAIICLWLSHRDLGSNWTPTLGVKSNHKLIKTGIYKYSRHPMYAAHILWAFGQIIILPNWIAGFSFIGFAILLPAIRIKDEETMMIEQFGEEYKHYMKTSGKVFPKIN
ncbi:MAG: isoprenylcysteine carboxylmethyltransferase family protein [Bacteroidales bacterium]|nr:isoprenylcysteine carboxylmethyltransferase family protein [Bacteroidales bacterium]